METKLNKRKGNVFQWLITTGYRPYKDEDSSAFLTAVKQLSTAVDEWKKEDILFLLEEGYELLFCWRFETFSKYRNHYLLKKGVVKYNDGEWNPMTNEKLESILSHRACYALEGATKDGKNLF